MPQSGLARALLILGIGLLVLLSGVAGYLYFAGPPSMDGVTGGSGKADIGGDFSLVDQEGRRVADEDFHGRYMLVFFGYTFCPDICPVSLSDITVALDDLAERAPDKAEQVVPVFITVDPERDTVEALNLYARHFHERLVALTGTPEEIAAAARAYKVFYQKGEDLGDGNYLVDHSGFIFLMNPDGEYLTHFSHADGSEKIAQGLENFVEG